MEYGLPTPWESIRKARQTVIVDFALPLHEMRFIHHRTKLVWVDHHKTSLQALRKLRRVEGRRSLGEAACALTWKTFFPRQPIPKAVRFIADRDLGRYNMKEAAAFDAGLQQEDTSPEHDALWSRLLDGDERLIDELISRGTPLAEARIQAIARRVGQYGFKVEFEGHRTLVLNTWGCGEMADHALKNDCGLAYCYIEAPQNGGVKTFVTLYSNTVDVSEIARKFDGGGHPSAAGFAFQRVDLPFPPGARLKHGPLTGTSLGQPAG